MNPQLDPRHGGTQNEGTEVYDPNVSDQHLISRYSYLSDHTPSAFQAKIHHFVDEDDRDGICNAVAGSGKTTTIVDAAGLISGQRGLFCAFNKHIAEELSRKLEGTPMTAKTVHSIGYGVLAKHLPGSGRLNVEGWKYNNIVRDYVQDLDMNPDKRREAKSVLTDLANLVRLNFINPEDTELLEQLCIHFDLGKVNGYLRFLPSIIRIGNRQAESGRTIDFNDMIYLPIKMDMSFPKYDFVMVDEAQDLNKCQLECALRSRRNGGRMLFVGDPHQAIYGFAGADAESFANIKARTDAVELPLSICYRCGKKIVQEAKTIVPHIQPFEDAPEGKVREISYADIEGELEEGDLVLCRTNAELISLCLELISKGRTARVKGRDIGKKLTDVLEEVEKRSGFEFDSIAAHLTDWAKEKREYLEDKNASENAFQMHRDKVAALRVCIEHFEATSVAHLCEKIESLFSNDKKGIWLSSIHKAKGLENDRVFIIKPDKLPLEWEGQMEWQYEQERNLRYVAITRAINELVWVRG